MTDAVEIQKQKRPTSITVICVVMFLGVIITVPMIFSQLAQQVGSWYPPYLGATAFLGVVCLIGLWMMKK